MRIKQLLTTAAFAFSLMLGLSAQPAMAGPGHDHDHAHAPVSQTQAENVATQNVGRLIQAGKLDDSWKAVTVAEVSQKDFGGGPEWVVMFRNAGVSDPKKQTLYIFLSLAGEYLAANFTGE